MKLSSLKHMPPTDHFLRTGVALPGKNERLCPAAMIQSRGAQSLAQHTTARFLPQNHSCCIMVKVGYGVLPSFILVDFVLGERGGIAVGLVFFFIAFQNLAASFHRII